MSPNLHAEQETPPCTDVGHIRSDRQMEGRRRLPQTPSFHQEEGHSRVGILRYGQGADQSGYKSVDSAMPLIGGERVEASKYLVVSGGSSSWRQCQMVEADPGQPCPAACGHPACSGKGCLGNVLDHRPGFGHPCGPACLRVRCFSHKHIPSTRCVAYHHAAVPIKNFLHYHNEY